MARAAARRRASLRVVVLAVGRLHGRIVGRVEVEEVRRPVQLVVEGLGSGFGFGFGFGFGLGLGIGIGLGLGLG